MITAIIADLDGVIIDFCDIHRECFQKALLVGVGLKIEDEYHNLQLNGNPTSVKLQKLGITGPNAIRVAELKQQYTLEAIKNIQPDKELKDLLLELSLNYNIFCASNSLHETVELVLTKLGVIDLFDGYFGNDDVSFSKPSPEMYLKAACIYGASIKECLVIEDSPIGEQAIKNSGMYGLMIKNRQDLTLDKILLRIKEIENG
jgi:HAD superfamily hydrolase (TIGR01509 family)